MSKCTIPEPQNPSPRVTLKRLAEHLKLDPSTVSLVLNNAPNRSIPESTRQRVREAAAHFGYQPNYIARLLQRSRTQTIGIMLPELGDGYHSQVLNGVADVLMREDYFFFTAHHRHRTDLVCHYPGVLQARGAEALLVIDTRLETAPALPTVSIAGHKVLSNVTQVVLDHDAAAELAIGHLHALGHRRIAFMRGQPFSSDADSRWDATMRAAQKYDLPVLPELVIALHENTNTPELGYPGIASLLHHKRSFTAVLCFNDVSAIGVMRALSDAGLRVPTDCSVMGFDDIPAAAYQIPRLTTIRQPLRDMGSLAAELLLRRIGGEQIGPQQNVQPTLVIRQSTAPPPGALK